ncbi:MAG: DUF4325 domain-containing protein [Gammaproteobacteria bacterium]|jgi:hypothetical protein
MTSTFKIKLKKHFPEFISRKLGMEAREFLINELKNHKRLEVDLSNCLVTPSFADECIGILAAQIGLENFNKNLAFKGVKPEIKSLFIHVISCNLSKHKQ